MASNDRTAKIWSTRLQKEFLALTSPRDGDDEYRDLSVGVLLPFVTVGDHHLDIERGDCKITFCVDLREVLAPAPTVAKTPEDKAVGDKSEEAERRDNEQSKEAQNLAAGKAAAAEASASPSVAVTFDLSLPRSPNNQVVASSPDTYPFQAPEAFITSGAAFFPEGGNISDGDRVEIDLDWTPSLHLNDAVQYISLRIRESIRKDERFNKLVVEEEEDNWRDIAGRIEADVGDAVNWASNAMGSVFTAVKSGVAKATTTVDEATTHQPVHDAAPTIAVIPK